MTVSDSVAGQSDQQRDGPHSQDEDNYNVKSAFGQSDQQRDGLPSLSNISSQEEASSTVVVTSKRKRQSMFCTTAVKKRRVTKHLPPRSISEELNISSWWRRTEREERRSSYRLVNYTKLETGRKMKNLGWKLSYMSLWWRKMVREGMSQLKENENQIMKNSLNKFLQAENSPELPRRTINTEQIVTEKKSVNYLRTAPENVTDNDVIKECPPTSAMPKPKQRSLAVIGTPGKGTKRSFSGGNESPAKLPREGSSKYDASQQLKHTANILNTPYDERNNFEVIRERTSLDLDYMDSDLWISAGISELE
jgi:hypothetical protein